MPDKLAIDGGTKTVINKLAMWPQFSEEAIKAVQEVLRSGKVNYWTGPRGMECERKFAQWQGSQGADIRIPDVEKMSTNRTVDLPQALLKQSIPIDAPVPNGQVRWILDML